MTVSQDINHLKYNRLHCMIEIPPLKEKGDGLLPTYYLAFPVGEKDSDLTVEGINFSYTLYSEGWHEDFFSYDFQDRALGHTKGVLFSARSPSAARTSIDVCLNNLVNFMEGDAKLCVFQLNSWKKYQLTAFCTIRKRLRNLSIERFVSDKALIESGESVTFSWSLYGERAYRLLPFDSAMSADIPASRTVKLTESTDVVLEVSNFLDTDAAGADTLEDAASQADAPRDAASGADTLEGAASQADAPRDAALQADNLNGAAGGEDRAVLQKGLRVAVWDSLIVTFGLSLPGGTAQEKLTVKPGKAVNLSWEVSHLGERQLTIEPSVSSDPLPAKGSVTLSPKEDTVYTLRVSGKNQLQATASLYLDEVKIRGFTAEPQSLLYGDNVCFRWDLKNAESASIAPDVGALVPTDGRKEFTVKATQKYKLTAKGKLSDGTEATAESAPVTVTLSDPLIIQDFRVETAFFDGDNYIKVFHWKIDYPGNELKISVLVDDRQVLYYTDGASRKTDTEYINCRYHQRAVLMCEGRNGQTATKEIRK